ncbi:MULTISPECIES: SsgA family sporulation/cell division regulator [unclassified Streptomyces]|uniref:SsgA family sporulation/cell division regulator n=1 Tax=unclassified Streptomyces TaxID=2593676 RepID=UPI00165559BE|nr:SsgA family sporulation/cell division regulator [Streptomyces sp. CB02980]MCB8901083.1 SsgA family sporulation/cell division regulator [Streptomyces sp. CB02980]
MPQPPVAPLPAPRVLTQPMAMELLTPDAAVPIETTVGYTSRDPHALSIVFHLLGDDPVVWRVDREMVLTGSLTATGAGEVHLRPAPDGRLLLRLGPAGHCAMVRCDQDRLARLVRDTFVLVAQGTEESHIDWQPLLASLRR